MKKIILALFAISLFFSFFFLFFVLFGELPFVSAKQKEYRDRLLSLEKYYDRELLRIEKKAYTSLINQSFPNWLDGLLKGENYINLFREEARMMPNKLLGKKLFGIKDPFLINFVVVDEKGKLLYTYDRFDGDPVKLSQIALLGWDGFSVENNEMLNLTFPTDIFYNSAGEKLKKGYLVLIFNLKKVCRRIFFKMDTNFQKSHLISYRYGFVYNTTVFGNVENKVSQIIDKAYRINNKWKFITSAKDEMSFIGYRLSSGVLFAYLYPSALGDMSYFSQIMLLLFFVNLTIFLAFWIYKRGFKDKFLFLFKKWILPPIIPAKFYRKYWQKKSFARNKSEEIISLLKELDEKEKAPKDEYSDERSLLGVEWSQELAKETVSVFLKNKELFYWGEERFLKIKNILDEISSVSSGDFAIIAILEKQNKKWAFSEYSGINLTTAKNFCFEDDHPLIKSFFAGKSAVCIKSRQKDSSVLRGKLSEEDYRKIYGILFVPIAFKESSNKKREKNIKMIVVLG